MASIVDSAEALATALDGDWVATIDPLEAANNRPCFLVTPPVLDYAGGTMTEPDGECRIQVLSSLSTWNADTLRELEPLVEHAASCLPLLQRAEAGIARLGESQTAPCYVLTTDL